MLKLDRVGTFYRVPTPGAIVENGKLEMNSIFPGLPMEYRVDDGDWMSYSAPVDVDGNVEVRVTTADGKSKGRSLTLDYARIHRSLN